jgi:hypothetical protein
MHWVVAGDGQSRDDHIGRCAWRDRPFRQRIANDAVIHLRVERTLVERNPGAAGTALLAGLAEANVDVGPAIAFRILERHQKSTRRRRVVAIVYAAPRIDVDHSVRGGSHLAGMADVVCENGCAEPGCQGDSAIVTRTSLRIALTLGG